ncbi:MAG: Maf-like protein [Deltaproteobacteria bacterium]|nr:Maf-like protein [Deltaproteobacteria bacterium]
MRTNRLVLASSSPRRRELLGAAGFRFVIEPSFIEELVAIGEDPWLATVRLAVEKAEAVAERADARDVVLAADTAVVIDDRIVLGKPASRAEAVEMLLSLSGRNHTVLTAWAILRGRGSGAHTTRAASGVGVLQGGLSRSVVRMREIARREAEAYADTGEPMDKAGAYAAQGEGRRFIGAIVGPLDNVIGLPMTPVGPALARAGIVPRT